MFINSCESIGQSRSNSPLALKARFNKDYEQFGLQVWGGVPSIYHKRDSKNGAFTNCAGGRYLPSVTFDNILNSGKA